MPLKIIQPLHMQGLFLLVDGLLFGVWGLASQ